MAITKQGNLSYGENRADLKQELAAYAKDNAITNHSSGQTDIAYIRKTKPLPSVS